MRRRGAARARSCHFAHAGSLMPPRPRGDLEVEEELAVAGRTDERRLDFCPHDEPERGGMLANAIEDPPVHGRVADDAAARLASPSLELGLDQGHDPPTCRCV